MTTKKPLKYLWRVEFEDKHVIWQPENDHYSKHDESAEWNPSSFRDILDYEEKSRISHFQLISRSKVHSLDFETGNFQIGSERLRIGQDDNKPEKLIYFRNINHDYIDGIAQEPYVAEYCFGYEYKNKNGKTVKRIITLDGK